MHVKKIQEPKVVVCLLFKPESLLFSKREQKSQRQLERLLSFLFSSWLLVVLQPGFGRTMWQEPLGWEMTVKLGPIFRACTEKSLKNHKRSNITHTEFMHMHILHTAPNTMSFLTPLTFSLCWCSFKATFTIPVSSLNHLREKVDLYASGFLSAVAVWSKENRVVQTKAEKHLGDTKPQQTSHFTAVSPPWWVMMIHHNADNESPLSARFESAYCKPLYRWLELLCSLQKLKASLQINV